jgi:ribosomal protein S18 acetylase RimI-like enzyme
MNTNESLQQATRSDTSEIAAFISRAACIHRHLDWQGVLDWIPSIPFVLLKEDNKLKGLLTCPPNFENIVWIRCFACHQFNDLSYVWDTLFNHVIQMPELSNTILYSVGLNDWFGNLLMQSHFENYQNIVILYWNHSLPHPPQPDKELIIRSMEASDLAQVAELDKISFESMWVNPADKVVLAYDQSEHSSVAEINGRIVGYEMTTANHFSAHLARIAIHPEFQKQHIGSAMISEMLKYFRRKGIDQISVNTQDNNSASLALYQSLGFELSGESFPVYRYQV